MSEETQGGGKSVEEEQKELKERMSKLEEDPPEKLEDWPDDDLKYQTFGGPEGDHSYEEGPERQLGPSSLQRHEDGSVSIEGEKVDDPDEYKTEPLEGLDVDHQGEQSEELREASTDGEDAD
jgi:hypothetical protein